MRKGSVKKHKKQTTDDETFKSHGEIFIYSTILQPSNISIIFLESSCLALTNQNKTETALLFQITESIVIV